MSTPNPLQSLRRIALKLFPFLARFSISSSGNLVIKAANGKIDLAGGGTAALRVGDVARLYLETPASPAVPILWVSFNGGATWSAVSSGVAPPVPGVTTGTALAPSGSGKVTIG